MKRLCLVGCLLFATPVFAEDTAEVLAGVDVVSAYVWRGITYNDGAAIQPRISIGAGSISAEIWGNYNVDDYQGSLTENELSEIDLTLSWGIEGGYGSMSLGFVEYVLVNEESEQSPESGTREVFAAFESPEWEGLSALAAVYYDFDELKDLYASAGISYSKSVSDDVTLSLVVSAGYAGKDWAPGGKEGLHDLTAGAEVAWSITDKLSVNLAATFVDSLDDEVLPDAIVFDVDPDDDITPVSGLDADWIGSIGIAYIL
jgi:hypothetical protein